MIDLGTTYLDMRLRTPLVASASPLSQELDGIRRLEDAGASPRVLQSLLLTFLSPANSAPALTLI
jgi:dihydroorotate dehydrogenase (fumarate)